MDSAESPLDSFCGSAFWDWNLTWNADVPDFTECFHRTVLVWVPCAALWLMAPFEVYWLLHSRRGPVPLSPVNVVKMIVTSLLVSLSLISLFPYLAAQQGATVADASCVSAAVLTATFMLVLGFTWAGKRKGVQSSGPIFLFWFLLTISWSITLYHQILVISDGIDEGELFSFAWFVVHYTLVLIMLVVNFFADAEPHSAAGITKPDSSSGSANPSPEEGASFPSRMVYQWFDRMVWRGFKAPLETKDLWDLNSSDQSRQLVPAFNRQWIKSVDQRAKTQALKAAAYSTASAASDVENGAGVHFKSAAGATRPTVSVLPALVRTFWPQFFFGACIKLVQDLLAFGGPVLLKYLIKFVEDPTQQDWKGYLYAVLLTFIALLQTIFLGQYFQRMYVVGMHIRTSIVAAIYRKALRVSSSARKESTVGEIVNLMSVDAQRFMDLTTSVNMLWSSPLQIGLAIYLLYQILGPSVFAGVGVMIVLVPINAKMADVTKKLQVEQMKSKDKRVKMMNEILSGIKLLKLYAWETSFQANVEDVRANEVRVLKRAAYLSAGSSFLWTIAPFLVTLTTFAVYVLTDPDHVLEANKAFVSLALFNLIRCPMNMFPTLVATFVQASVSLKRLNKFLNSDELDPECVSHNQDTADVIQMEKASFAWAADEPPCLKNFNLTVRAGQLVAVVGQVGSGKSSLVSALLGEMVRVGGRVNTRGRVAYVPQQAWIQNCTLRDNVTFGKSCDDGRYDQVVEACALKPDLEMLPAGDATEIGEKGINLSGGQKQRVSLARAVYADKDVYYLDDPLSAVDSHVGKHIFDKVIGPHGLLKNKTRLLVTHGITHLPQVDQIVVLKDGEITEVGSYKELLKQKGQFAEFLLNHLDEADDDGGGDGGDGGDDDDDGVHDDGDGLLAIKMQLQDTLGQAEFQRRISLRRSRLSLNRSEQGEPPAPAATVASPEQSLSRTSSTTSLQKNGSLRRRSVKERAESVDGAKATPTVAPAPKEKLVEVEKAQTGKVKLEVYAYYLRSVGSAMACLTLLLYVVYQGFSLSSNIWLSRWASARNNSDSAVRDLYLGVYGALGFGQAASVMAAAVLMSASVLRAASVLHAALLAAVLRLPMAHFETTPTGRLLNRFSKDVDAVDNTLTYILRGWVMHLLSVISTVIVIGYATPYFFYIALPVGVVYYWIQHFYVATSRQLKRLESVSRSPIYSHFSETLTGASVIRAYGQETRFMDESERLVDVNQKSYYPSIIANRWLSLRLETIGNLVVLFAGLFAVIGRDSLDPGLAGLSISYALNVTTTLNWFMRMTSEVETNIVAVERIKEYCDAVQEASWDQGKVQVGPDWPDRGDISFNDYQVRYREGLDLVLKGVSCKIHGGEKVGIVGRTGAGKSSLTLGLFRIVEAAGGRIVIDGVDIAELGLHALRSRLTIIPQDPVLFSGTLRTNLDPFHRHTDDGLWLALEHAHLKEFVRSLPAGLEHEASEGGENLSVGQRQLICLARALLRKTKVLVLDEATASVDMDTDDLIQATIRKEFQDCTVVTIAHRLHTIMDSNRVMVLDRGVVREFAPPAQLLADKQSLFYAMAKDAGLV